MMSRVFAGVNDRGNGSGLRRCHAFRCSNRTHLRRLARIPYLPKRATREEKFVETDNGGSIEREQSAGRSRDTMEYRDTITQTDNSNCPEQYLKCCECCIERRVG